MASLHEQALMNHPDIRKLLIAPVETAVSDLVDSCWSGDDCMYSYVCFLISLTDGMQSIGLAMTE